MDLTEPLKLSIARLLAIIYIGPLNQSIEPKHVQPSGEVSLRASAKKDNELSFSGDGIPILPT